MTAFARAESEQPWGSAQLELRSVNNRYLDIAPRLPDELRPLEPVVREHIGSRLGRGKLDCVFKISYADDRDTAFTVNVSMAEQVVRAIKQIQPLLEKPHGVTAMEVLRWPGVIQASAPDLEAIRATAMKLLDGALDELIAMRTREGEKITAMIVQRCDSIEAIVSSLRGRAPVVLEDNRRKLLARLEELEAQPDPERLEQEMLYLAQKLDITEELDRLDAHLAEVRQVLESNEPVGRRLDFLMQELNREANTIGSKSSDAETTRFSVDLKVYIEQIREQVQNVE
ncbi:MAG TPA: YicC/YloC family endoribonuclease [Gammaproteobacteria bacterium]|nr:YicC/YloC family endoribonuclease [Gammaproteobacteria bacterium]